MPPENQANAALARVIDQLFELLVRPARPEPLDDVILEAKLTSHARERLHFVEGVRAAIEIFPDCAPGFHPIRLHTIWKQLRIGGWAEIVRRAAIDQCVQIRRDHADPPWRRDGARNRRWP